MVNARQIAAMVDGMAAAINARGLRAPLLIGIHTGGAWLAERLQPLINCDGGDGGAGGAGGAGAAPPLGSIDISFYRDDFSRVGLNPQVKASELPVAVDDRDIILVDDVLHTGRTIRAALNEVFSYGRPERVCLAVLIERPGRELPIQADIVGESMNLNARQEAKLSRDASGNLTLDIIDLGDGGGGAGDSDSGGGGNP